VGGVGGGQQYSLFFSLPVDRLNCGLKLVCLVSAVRVAYGPVSSERRLHACTLVGKMELVVSVLLPKEIEDTAQ
jgi:hypothetical protein